MTKSLISAPDLQITDRLRVDPDRLRSNYERFEANRQSKNTRVNYACQLRHYVAWCEANGRVPVPADDATVTAFISHLFDSGKKRATIDVSVAAIKRAHLDAGEPDPFASGKVKAMMQGVIRTLVADGRSAPSVKENISQDDLRALAAAAGDSSVGVRDRALVLVAYAGWCRRGEPLKLRAERIVWKSDSAQCFLGATKTDQTGDKDEYITVPRVTDESICGYRALRTWLDLAQITAGPVFVQIKSMAITRIALDDPGYVNKILTRLAKRAGIDPARVAPHRAFRASPITVAAEKGIDPAAIADGARHRSFETTRRYIRRTSRAREAVARAVYE